MSDRRNRPNVLWLVSEDNSPEYVGPYGNRLARTPALDRLAAAGMAFDRAFATAPVCAPSRFSIIAGRYASSFAPANQMRSKGDAPGSWEGTLPSWVRGFPAYLREAGYYCTNNAKEDYNAPIDVGDAWDESSRTAHWRNRPAGEPPFFAVFNYLTTHESSVHSGAPGPLDGGVRPDEVRLPEYLPDLPELRADCAWYHDQNTRLDGQVAQRLAELEADGLADDTIVFYYADHGGVLPRSKRFCYDSGLRVPLIVFVPEKWRHLWPVTPGTRTGELVTLMDLGPTVLSLADLKPPDHLNGRAIAGEYHADPSEYVFGLRNRIGDRYDFVRTARDARYRYVRNYLPYLPHGQHSEYLWRAAGMRAFDAANQAGQLDGPPTAFFTERPFEELYDLDADPDEITNLATRPDAQQVLGRLRGALDDHMLATRDNGFIPEGSALEGSDQLGDPDVYPLQHLMAIAAVAASRDTESLPQLIERMSDDHELVRYWATTGCVMLRDQAEPARSAIYERLDDDSPHVRIAAAEALCWLGDNDRAWTVLEDLTVNHEHPRVRLQAINALDRVRGHIRPGRSTLEHAQQDPLGDLRKVADYMAKFP